LVAVEYGCGRCGCPSPGTARWGTFRERFFAAGHTHAGVVLVLPLTYFIYLGRAGYSTGVTVDARRSQPTVNT